MPKESPPPFSEQEDDLHIEEIRKRGIKTKDEGQLWLISRLSENLDEQHKLATIDALTGLLNRRGFERAIEGMLSQKHSPHADQRKFSAIQYHSFSVLEIDIDHFKSINDQYGHDVGDIVIKEVARSMGQGLREGDVISRQGGEEFLMLFPNAKAKDIQRRFENQPIEIEIDAPQNDGSIKKISIPVTVSGGIREFKSGEDFAAACKAADAALYEAKNTGRNKILVSGEADR